MFNINKENIITLTRGDSITIPLFINQGTKFTPIRYKLADEDSVYIGITYPNQSFENAVIRKKYTSKDLNKNGDVEVKFNQCDTQYLTPGTYYYEVKLLRRNKFIDTIVSKTFFYLI